MGVESTIFPISMAASKCSIHSSRVRLVLGNPVTNSRRFLFTEKRGISRDVHGVTHSSRGNQHYRNHNHTSDILREKCRLLLLTKSGRHEYSSGASELAGTSSSR